MPLFEVQGTTVQPVPRRSLTELGIPERAGLQKMLRENIRIIDDDTLVIAEEFGDWEESKRRIDLLGVDRLGNLVVIELKRDDDAHMELQAIRYAAMISAMSFQAAVDTYSKYLGVETETARTRMLDFFSERGDGVAFNPDEHFNKDVRIVLVATDFSKELTTAILWLRDYDIEIRCVRITPYRLGDAVLFDVQRILPLEEAEDYQIQLRQKSIRERVARRDSKDYTQFEVFVKGNLVGTFGKGRAILCMVKQLCAAGVGPARIAQNLPGKSTKHPLFQSVEGFVADRETFKGELTKIVDPDGRTIHPERYFCAGEDLIQFDGRTYAFTNQWGTNTRPAMEALVKAFPDVGVTFKECES